jgi:ERCC4-type nuclease
MWWGVQRKELKDLAASVEGGRLAKERLQWSELYRCFLIIETGERGGGAPREMPNGALAALGNFGRPWTGPGLRGLTYSLMEDGVRVLWVKDEAETLARVVELEAWSKKATHSSVTTRPTAPASVFGDRGNREYGVWLLSSLPGVGGEMAGRIWDHFGGLPVQMKAGVDADALTKIKGVGKVTAQRIMQVFSDTKG